MITAYGNGSTCVKGLKGYCTFHRSVWESDSPYCVFIEGHRRTAIMAIEDLIQELRTICEQWGDEIPTAIIESVINKEGK